MENSRAALFRESVDDFKRKRTDDARERRDLKMYRAVAPVAGISASGVSQIWRATTDGEDFGEILRGTYEALEDIYTYATVLSPKTLMGWLWDRDIVDSGIWKRFVRLLDSHRLPSILFTVKPERVWVLTLRYSPMNTKALQPHIVIPANNDCPAVQLLPASLFVEEFQ